MSTDDPLGIALVLDSVFPSVGGGGAEFQVQTLARRMHALGLHVTVIAPMHPEGPQVESERSEGYLVLRVRYPRTRLLGGAVLLLRLAALLLSRRHRHVAIHAHIAHHAAAVCCVVGRLTGKDVIVKVTGFTELDHGILSRPRGFFSTVPLLRAMMRQATTFQATSAQIAGGLVAAGFDAARVARIPNAVDTVRFAPPDALARARLRRRLDLPGGCTCVYVGRLEREKGADLLVAAWADAFAGREDVRLLLCGTGALRGELEALALRRGIAGQIRFEGAVRTVEDYLGAADFGVLASRFEGLSNTLLEYLAAGLPIVGTRVSGTEDLVVDGENGCLVPPGDAAALANALRRMADAGAGARAAMGEASRRRVLAYAGIDSVVARLVALYGVAVPSAAAGEGKN
jgi:glycosyltransferase involved in cell wall biosynthesis